MVGQRVPEILIKTIFFHVQIKDCLVYWNFETCKLLEKIPIYYSHNSNSLDCCSSFFNWKYNNVRNLNDARSSQEVAKDQIVLKSTKYENGLKYGCSKRFDLFLNAFLKIIMPNLHKKWVFYAQIISKLF